MRSMATDDVRLASVPLAERSAAVMYGLLGIGFGAGTAVTLALLLRDGQLPMTPWGFRSLDGPLARIGTTETLAFGGALILVCAVDSAAAVGLWHGRRWAGRMALSTTPFALALGAGFQLPFLLVGVPLRVATLLLAWRRLR
jgi:uncharacterized membrane protein (DUF2068 family)